MKIVVLLATYNGSKYILDQLDSIKNQTGDFFIDIYIRDDGSTDGTLDLISRYASDHRNVKILPTAIKRAGSASGNFFSILRDVPIGNYDYLALADQDDIWMSDKLLSALSLIIKNNSACYYSDLKMFYQDGRPEKILIKSQPPVKYDYFFQGGSAGCTYVIKTELAGKISSILFNYEIEKLSKYSHDWLIYALARALGNNWAIDSNPKILYRQHETNVQGGALGFKGVKMKLGKFYDGWYFDHVKFICEILSKNDLADVQFAQMIASKKRRINFFIHIIKNIFQFRRKKSESILVTFFIILGFI